MAEGSKEQELLRMIETVAPLNREVMQQASLRLDSLTKPPGSLGTLEAIAIQLAGITSQPQPELAKKAVVIMAADHGVCEEGVSAYPAEVTSQMVMNFLQGGAAVNVLARGAGADVYCVDIGVNGKLQHPLLLSNKLRYGTANIAKEAAMTREQAVDAIFVGIETATNLHAQGYRLLATGEMGIGNTTASSAIVSVLADISPERSVGRGTGIDEARRQHKIEVVQRAIRLNQPLADDPIDVLSKVGGLEIAALTGLIIGAAASRCPIVIDGFISSAAALAAVRLCPQSAAYLLASHLSDEQGHQALLQELQLEPGLLLHMRLGEGTGAVLFFHVIEAAVRLMREMATFDSAGVSR